MQPIEIPNNGHAETIYNESTETFLSYIEVGLETPVEVTPEYREAIEMAVMSGRWNVPGVDPTVTDACVVVLEENDPERGPRVDIRLVIEVISERLFAADYYSMHVLKEDAIEHAIAVF